MTAAALPTPVDPGQSGETARKRGIGGYFLLLPGGLWLVLFFLVPTITLVASSLYDPSGSLQNGYAMTGHVANYGEAIKEYAATFGRSLFYALTATVACIALGYPLAYAIAF